MSEPSRVLVTGNCGRTAAELLKNCCCNCQIRHSSRENHNWTSRPWGFTRIHSAGHGQSLRNDARASLTPRIVMFDMILYVHHTVHLYTWKIFISLFLFVYCLCTYLCISAFATWISSLTGIYSNSNDAWIWFEMGVVADIGWIAEPSMHGVASKGYVPK